MPKQQFLVRNEGLSDEEAQQWLKQVLQEQPEMSGNAGEETRGPDDEDMGAEQP